MKVLALTTCNNDYAYYRWIPHAVAFWRRLGFDFIVHFYADRIPDQLAEWSEHILLESPPRRLKLSSVCQISRLFLPALHRKYDQVLITDVDLLPLSQTYFDMVQDFPGDKFIAMRKKEGEFFMGFNCASPAMWQRLTKVGPDRQEINQALLSIFVEHRMRRAKNLFGLKQIEVKWGLDQKILKSYIEAMDERDMVCISGLKDVYSLLSGYTAKPAYFRGDGIKVDENWISDNKEKVAFYTRDDSRSLSEFEQEVGFLAGIYGVV